MASSHALMGAQSREVGGLAIIRKIAPVMMTGNAKITNASRIDCKYLFWTILPKGSINLSSIHSTMFMLFSAFRKRFISSHPTFIFPLILMPDPVPSRHPSRQMHADRQVQPEYHAHRPLWLLLFSDGALAVQAVPHHIGLPFP